MSYLLFTNELPGRIMSLYIPGITFQSFLETQGRKEANAANRLVSAAGGVRRTWKIDLQSWDHGEAIRRYRISHRDFVLPGLDGFEILKKEEFDLQNLPAVSIDDLRTDYEENVSWAQKNEVVGCSFLNSFEQWQGMFNRAMYDPDNGILLPMTEWLLMVGFFFRQTQEPDISKRSKNRRGIEGLYFGKQG